MKSLVLSLALAAAVASQASSQTVRCTIDPTPNRNYIAPSVELTLGEFGEVAVSDAIISASGRTKVFGEVVKDSTERLSVFWEVTDVKPDPKQTRAYPPHLVFRLTILKSTGAARMTILDTQLRRDNEFRTTGTCRFAT
jgi:hypothetical protein